LSQHASDCSAEQRRHRIRNLSISRGLRPAENKVVGERLNRGEFARRHPPMISRVMQYNNATAFITPGGDCGRGSSGINEPMPEMAVEP
jgi:hypothetical protein